MTNEIKDKQLKIIKHYGEEKQLDQLVEECSELIKAACKYKRHKEDAKLVGTKVTELITEMADVENLLEQFKLRHAYIKSEVEIQKIYKVNREIDRIARQ